MRITSASEIAQLVALRCEPARIPRVRELIAEAGILLRGHFQLQSGMHAEYFLRARGLAMSADLLTAFARELMELAATEEPEAAVLCPESAGFLLGNALARLADVPVVVAKTDMARRPTNELRWGELTNGTDVLLVNDVITSGASISRLCATARAHGASAKRVIALAALGSMSLAALNNLALQPIWLIECRWPLYPTAQCPLCQQQVPLILSAELG